VVRGKRSGGEKRRVSRGLVQRFAPAKVNLTLRVLGKRADGYHEIESVMVPLTLGDMVEVAFGGRGITLQCSDPSLETGEGNLAWRAARAFLGVTGIRRGVRIGLGKAIPVAAGLGGGSSDAAAVLLALNDLAEKPLGKPNLASLALGLGADVPFFLDPRPALARGIGEIVSPLPPMPETWFVLVNPGFSASAAWAYGRLAARPLRAKQGAPLQTLTSPAVRPKVRPSSRTWRHIGAFLYNDLEAVTLPQFPVLATLKERLLSLGAEGALVSGSGPTVFGVFGAASAARHAYASLKRAAAWKVLLARNL
jgi:4-diphosphocytidyl-2-C-methyl-D-erythritol kinase